VTDLPFTADHAAKDVGPGGASPAGGHDPARLRERQLELMLATDRRIIDHTNTLADTLQFIVSQT
jgi:hypothetical protein